MSRKIATAFTGHGFKQDKEDAMDSKDSTNFSFENTACMTGQDRVSRWLESTHDSDDMNLGDYSSHGLEKDSFEEVPLEEGLGDLSTKDDQSTDEALEEVAETKDEELPESWLLVYRELVFSTEAYEWLLARLQREFRLVPTESNTMQPILAKILSSLPSAHRISRKVSAQSCSARFELDWDILEFFTTQRYLNHPDEVFEGVITLTGSCQDGQAVTCAQYMHQTWPLTGERVVQLIKGVLRDEEGQLHTCKCLVPKDHLIATAA